MHACSQLKILASQSCITLAQCALAVSVDAKAEMKQFSNVAKQRILARAAGYGGGTSGT